MNTALSLRALNQVQDRLHEAISALTPSPLRGEGRGEGGIRRLRL